MGEKEATLNQLFLNIGLCVTCFAIGFFACFYYYKEEQNNTLVSIRKEIESNLDAEIYKILESQIRGLKKFTHKNPEPVNIDYFDYFVLHEGKCHFTFSNKNKHGDIKPHVRMAFYDKRGLCLGQTDSLWLISSISAGLSRTEIEDSTVYKLNDITYYTIDLY